MMRTLICKYSPLLAGIDAILGVFLLFLLGGFELGAAWTGFSAMISLVVVAGCGWMAWKSLLELKNLSDSASISENLDKTDTAPTGQPPAEADDKSTETAVQPPAEADDKSTETTGQPPAEVEETSSGGTDGADDTHDFAADKDDGAVAIHYVDGFDRLAEIGGLPFPMPELTVWLKDCREHGGYPFALPCDGRVLADVRNSGFSNVWVMGDVHGDSRALSAAFSFADEWTRDNSAEPPVFVSLGDLFDRGENSLDTLLKFLGEAKNRAGRVGWLAGNHDFGFHFDESQGCFASSTYPNEFTMWLNAKLEDAAVVAFGREVAALCGKLPSAAVIPGDVWLLHGGVPHRDLQERIAGIAALEDSDMRHDFVWGRLHESLKRKRPSREANCQIGVQDVKDFLSIMDNVCGIGCKAILRGHDHFAERVRVYDAYAPLSVVTLNTCSTLKDGAYSAVKLDFTPPAVAHCLNGSLEIYRIAK